MKVSEIMSRGIEFIDSTASVQAAAELMGEIEVGALPVGSPAEVEGVVTDRDILYRLVARGLDPAATTVLQVLSRPVITCRSDDTVETAMDLMASNHIRRLPVVDGTGSVVGWITLADLSRPLLVNNVSFQNALRELTEQK